MMSKMNNAVIASVLLVGAVAVAHAQQAPVIDAFAQRPQQSAQPAQRVSNSQRVPQQITQAIQPPPQQVMVQADDGQAQLRGNAQSMLLQKLNSLQTQLQQLQGKLEVQHHDISLLQEQQRTLYQDLDKRLTRITSGQSSQAQTNSQGAAISYGANGNNSGSASATSVSAAPNAILHANSALGAQTPATKTGKTKSSAQTATKKHADNQLLKEQLVYKAAYKEILARNFAQALADFQMFVQQYPDSRFIPNAHYWIGKLLLLKGDVNSAIKQFQTVTSKNPQDPKAADAMYELGYIYYSQSKWQQAKRSWKKVIRQFPKSNAAQLSRSHLQQLAKEGHS